MQIDEKVQKQPTQFGAAVSWSALCVALLVAIFLGTNSNVQHTTNLLPPSSEPRSGSAIADFEFTIRAYSSAAHLTTSSSTYCKSMATGLRVATTNIMPETTGFQSSDDAIQPFTIRTLPEAQSCAIAIDCPDCNVRGVSSTVTIELPYENQMLEVRGCWTA